MIFETVRKATGVARDILALAFTPVVTAIAVWLICILAYSPWGEDTEPQRIHYIGAIAIISIILVGFGGQWFQRNRIASLKGSGPLGTTFEVETQEDNAEHS